MPLPCCEQCKEVCRIGQCGSPCKCGKNCRCAGDAAAAEAGSKHQSKDNEKSCNCKDGACQCEA